MSLTEIKQNIKNEIRNALSVEHIHDFFFKLFKKNVRIVDVHQVETYYTLNDLFVNDITQYKCSINNKSGPYIDNLIILFIPVINIYYGHYQLILKNNNKIYFFDSYADTYNSLVEEVNNGKKDFYIPNNFGNLVLNSKLDININKYKYQSNNINDSTCGYHCSICAFFFLVYNNPDFTKYNEFISKYINDFTHTKYDAIVIYLFKNLKLK